MLITRKSPFQAELSWLQDEMNRVFGLETRGSQASFEPNVAIWEQDGQFLLEMELPGFAQEDVNIEILPTGVLSIQGERSLVTSDDAKLVSGYKRYGRIQKEYKLPNSVEPDSIDARLLHGMLTITLGKKAKAKARKIDVA
ncbi:MAG: hypothetical protein CMJ82_05720 [Planctomycetaceae bacterium]|nr:hypothetical protein [Planctomycetaceae bacterium]|tara:strand:- start:237 stop:659 length:423 start_codon:yes stop_codon:yes gene_type:complete